MAGRTTATLRSTIGTVFIVAATAAGAQVPYVQDFSGSDIGWSGHTYAPPEPATNGPSGPLWQTQTSTVDTDPNKWHSLWASYGDHTTGSGKMLIINAAADGVNCAVKVWRSPTITVTPGKDYVVSYWAALSISPNPPLLKTSINGVVINTQDGAAFGKGTWTEVKFNWSSGAAATATIEICDDRTMTSGDDYALDDISLRYAAAAQWCSPGYWRQPQHLDSWPPGISPQDLYSSHIQPVPPVNTKPNSCRNASALANPSLFTVLNNPQCFGGDATNKVADLLSEAHPDINYIGSRVENCPLN